MIVYDKIWQKLPKNEKTYLRSFNEDSKTTEDIINSTGFNSKECSGYRDRLIKSGIIEGIVMVKTKSFYLDL